MAFRWTLLTVLTWVGASFGQASEVAGPSAAEVERILRHNEKVAASRESDTEINAVEVERPFAEYEETGYFLMNSDFSFNSYAAKIGMVKNLPKNVTAVIVAGSDQAAQQARQTFSSYIDASRLRVISIAGGGGFWARDTMPVPVFTADKRVGLVDARYYKGIEPDSAIARYFKLPLFSHQYTYEGGNFLADSRGNCIAVADRIGSMSDELFRRYYGCKRMRRLPQISGIGHIDEHAKFISDKVVVTDLPAYAEQFEKDGYKVQLLPRAVGRYETYLNAVMMNDTIFMPTYGRPADEKARAIYESLGFEVHGFSSNTLSNNGLGSLHCISMTYPKMKWNELLSVLDAR